MTNLISEIFPILGLMFRLFEGGSEVRGGGANIWFEGVGEFGSLGFKAIWNFEGLGPRRRET